MMSHWSKGAAGAGYTGKVPGVQMKHDCIYFPKRFTTDWHSGLGCTIHYSLSVRFILAAHFLGDGGIVVDGNGCNGQEQ